MKKLFIYLSAILLLASCEDPLPENNQDDNPPQEVKAEIKVEVNSLSFTQEKGNQTLSFTSTADWTAEVINTRADSWCIISPQKGGAGNAKITVNTTANETPDDRTASIVIRSGTISKTVTISQKQKDALTVTAAKYEIRAEGGEILIEVKANVDFEYEVEEAAKEWVKYVETRAMKTSTLVFNVAENDDIRKREAKIIVRSGNIKESISIYQEGTLPSIVISQNEYFVTPDGETISVEVRSNVDVSVELPSDVKWISENITRATSTNTYRFDIAPNEEYDQRSAKIKFTNKENGLSEQVTVTQAQKDAIVLAKSEYEFGADGGSLDFEVQTNIDIVVTVSDNAIDWIHQVETKGLEVKSLRFNVMASSSIESREGAILLSGGSVTQTVTIKQNGMKEFLENEREALISFFNATGGDNWLRKDNWCTDMPVGEWYGITTDPSGLVSHMNLNDNNLTGSIPECVSNLRNLEWLCLEINKLSGEIPESIGNLTKLRRLVAYNNNLTGNIPESIGNMESLECLWLEGNSLSGELPYSIGSLSNLQELYLSYNALSGSLPESINNLTRLEYINIINNYFTGIVPKQLMEMSNWQTNWHNVLYQLGEGFSNEGLIIPAPKFREPTIDGKYLDYSVYSENEYTILYHYFDWCNWAYSFTPELVELYNGYRNKGLEVIAFSGEGTVESHKNFAESLNTEWPYILLSENRDIFNAHAWISPGICVVDKSGYIVFNSLTDDYNEVEAFLLEKLGPPDPSDPSDGPTFYESTDYSKDGEVKQLQVATKGKGIDIILMGDAYTDRLIADGTYDAVMQNAVDKFFTEEPYRSFRDHFNVYSVTAVSKNEIYSPYTETALRGYFGTEASVVGGDDSIAFSYALKAIDEESVDQALVVVMMNSDVFAGTCYMYTPSDEGDWSNGASVSYFTTDSSDELMLERLIHHEACGHGFAKLADEYSEGHIEDFPKEEVDVMKAEQNNWGWWKNVDFTSDLSQIRWSHFINDPRYADEGIGAYEGGLKYLTGVWRPTVNSIMRYNWDGFNAPSREAIYYRIHKLAYGPDWKYDYEQFVEYDAINRATATGAASAAISAQRLKINYVEEYFEPTPPPVLIKKTWREALR